MPAYKRPPIAEAIIELRLTGSMTADAIADAARRAVEPYFHSDDELNVTVEVNQETQQPRLLEMKGKRLSSGDRADLTIFRPNTSVFARLAPYLGWDQLRARAHRDWTALRREASIPVGRIGVRYINRLDIPTEADTVEMPDYLTFYPRQPDLEDVGPMTTYVAQVRRPLGNGKFNLQMTTMPVPSPLVGHASFLLDIDVSREIDIPRRDSDIWSIVDEMRAIKNRVFEACVTDRARELFSK